MFSDLKHLEVLAKLATDETTDVLTIVLKMTMYSYFLILFSEVRYAQV